MWWHPNFVKVRDHAITVLFLMGVFGAWEWLYRSNLYPPHLFPGPSAVWPALVEMAKSGELAQDFLASSFRWITGFIIGTVLGVPFGMICGRLKFIRMSIGGLLNGLSSIPKIVMIPIAILWFGLGETQKVSLVAWGAFFPVWLSSMEAALHTPRELVWVARSYNLTPLQSALHIFWPSAIPHIVAGIRIAISTATFSLAAAEMSGAFSGLAYRVFYSHEMFQTDKMMAGIFVITVLSWLVNYAFMKLVKYLAPWAT